MTYETITTESQGRVGILRLNRPEKLNAWTPTMIAEAVACLNAWAQDPAIGAIVLTLRHRPGVRRQSISAQVSRDPKTAIETLDVKPGEGVS